MDGELEFYRPRTLDTTEYVKARVDQIAELLEVVDNPAHLGEVTSGPRTVFQRLPRHLRRRAMSHNVKRLPRALRPIAARHTAKTLHRKKAPSRIWRRRPSRMLKRLVRERKKSVWLETHIWHAKRFHMQSLWGYKLPMRCCQRGFRPNYRCSVRSAVILDQSYLCSLQFMAMENNTGIPDKLKVKLLLDTLFAFCQKRVSPTFANPGAISGRSEVPLMLFTPGKYPQGFIGPARASWSIGSNLSLNLWIHPSMEKELLAEMEKIPNISVVTSVQLNQKKNADKLGDGKPIKLSNLRGRICRFHLSGPKALAYLHNVLIPVADNELCCSSDFEKFRPIHEWWRTLPPNGFSVVNLSDDGTIVCLLVEDPRLFRASPKHRRITTTNPSKSYSSQNCHSPPPNCHHLFWDWRFYRDCLLPKRLSHAEFERFCAGKLALPKRTDFKIPILLVLRRSSTFSLSSKVLNTAMNTSVDFICPTGVGYDFWLALQFGKCRAVGICDKNSLDFECGISTFPNDCPDCLAGLSSAREETKNLAEKHERKPLNRRIEYAKELRVEHPFSFEWANLLTKWGGNNYKDKGEGVDDDNNHFFVLRDRQMLKQLELWFGRCAVENALDEKFDHFHSAALVPVSLTMLGRGVVKRLALIFVPTNEDLELFRKEGPKAIIKEEMVRDGRMAQLELEEEINGTGGTDDGECNNSADKNKKRRRVSAQIPEFLSLTVSSDQQNMCYFPAESASLLTTSAKKLVSLHELFPDTADKDQARRSRNRRERMRKREKRKKTEGKAETSQGSEMMETSTGVETEEDERRLIGRVTRGDYAFSRAKGIAFGYVPLGALKVLKQSTVIVRNTTSKYYHPAKLAVCSALFDL